MTTHQLGNIYEGPDNEKFMLVASELSDTGKRSKINLINLETGWLWADPLETADIHNTTDAEFTELVGIDEEFKYVGRLKDIIFL
jgi:hypothetical protein